MPAQVCASSGSHQDSCAARQLGVAQQGLTRWQCWHDHAGKYPMSADISIANGARRGSSCRPAS